MNTTSFFQKVFFILIFFFLFLSFYQPIETEDGWWHLSAGRWMFEHQQIPHDDVFAPTEVKSPWYLTQWLGSLIFYLVYHISGFQGVMVFRALVLTSVAAIFVWYARKKIPLPLLLILTAFLWRGLEARNLLRPQIFNFLFVSLFLMILYGYRRTLNLRRLILLPVLGIFWVNLHLGSFVYGVTIIAAFLLGSILEYIVERYSRRQQGNALRGKATQIKWLFLALCGYVAIFFINPYGIDGFLFPFKVFLVPDFIQFYKFKRIISEMASPVGSLGFVPWVQFAILAGIAVGTLYKSKKKDFASIVLLVFGALIFLQSMRAVALFILISVYVIAECFVGDAGGRGSKSSPQSQRYVYILMAFVLLACGIMSVYPITSRRSGVQLFARGYVLPGNPQKAVEYLKEHGVEGVIFTDAHLGGYLIWAGYPHLRPFTDGRQLNWEYFKMHLDVLERPPSVWDSMEERFGFAAVVLDMNFSQSLKLINHLAHSGRWRQAYRDRDAVVYVRKDTTNSVEVCPDLWYKKPKLETWCV